jgi:hypothetical protein
VKDGVPVVVGFGHPVGKAGLDRERCDVLVGEGMAGAVDDRDGHRRVDGDGCAEAVRGHADLRIRIGEQLPVGVGQERIRAATEPERRDTRRVRHGGSYAGELGRHHVLVGHGVAIGVDHRHQDRPDGDGRVIAPVAE